MAASVTVHGGVVRRLQRASSAGGVALAAVGVVVLIGWLLDVPQLKSVHPALATMKPNTALAFVLLGLALALRRDRDHDRGGAVHGLAAGAVIIGSLTLLERAFHWNLGIDDVLFHDALHALGKNSPGRMSPSTAANFAVLGSAVLLLDVRWGRARHSPSQWLALLTTLTALLTLLGYLYGVWALYKIAPFASVAVHTALAFLVGGLAVFCVHPEEGLARLISSDSSAATTARRLLPGAVVVPALLGWMRLKGQQAGLYETEFGVALYAVSSTVSFAILIAWNSIAILRAEEREQSVEASLAQTEEDLRITLRGIRHAVTATDRTESRFRRLTESGIVGIVQSDVEGKVVEANDAFLAIVGYSRDDLLAGRISGTALNVPERERTDAAAGEELRTRRTTSTWEKELVHKDGSRVPVLVGVTMIDESTCVTFVSDLTEKRRREDVLRRKEARLTALYEAGILGVIVATLDGRVLEINEGLLGMLGYSSDELLSGKVAWRSLTPPEWREADGRAIESLRTNGVLAMREKEFLHKSGRRIPVMVGSKLLAGSADETISFVLDLTQNKEAALAVAQLREVGASEARFRALLEAGPDAGVIVDAGGAIVLVNSRTEKLFGYARSELLGKPANMLVPERFRTPSMLRTGSFPDRVLARGRTIEVHGLCKDGSEFPVEISLSPIETEEGILLSAAIRDVTERKKAEEQRSRLAAIVDSSADAIIGKTLDGVVTSWNEGAHRIFGYASEEIVGKPISLLIPPDRQHEEPEILRKLASGERIEQFDTIRRRKDGLDIHVSLTCSPVVDATGRLVGASKVVRDITERRRAEAAIAHAKDAAEAANRELEAFSYSVAHDLRAPLRGMNGFAQVLVDTYGDKLDADAHDWLQEILSNAKKMAELIDGLLSLARTSRSELRREDVDLSALAREVTDRLATSEADRTVAIAIQDRLTANADPRLLRALFDNLFRNAWKFTSKVSAPRVEFGATDVDGGPGFFVRDNGAGFDMAYVGKLFAPFQRLHTNDEFSGTGIGLATVQRIIHRHGGRIWAEGAVDKGATFYFTFPG